MSMAGVGFAASSSFAMLTAPSKLTLPIDVWIETPRSWRWLIVSVSSNTVEPASVLISRDAAAAPVELDQTRVGRLSRMDALQAQAMSLDARRRRHEQLAGVARALARLDADDYGYCEECGDEIAAGRLEFDPTATLCIACASRREN